MEFTIKRNYRLLGDSGSYGRSYGPVLLVGPGFKGNIARLAARKRCSHLRLSGFFPDMKLRSSNLDLLAMLPAENWEAIDIYDLDVSDFTPVKRFQNLRHLGLGMRTKGITIADFPVLEYLSFYWDPMGFWDDPPETLETLHVDAYRSKGLDFVSCLKNLLFLQVDSRTITSLDGLENCRKLEELQVIGATKLASVAGLEPLRSLRKLSLTGARAVADLEFLRSHLDLTELDLHNCGIFASLRPIRALRNLEVIRLTGDTKISDGDLSFLLDLPKLRHVVIEKRGGYKPRLGAIVDAIRI